VASIPERGDGDPSPGTIERGGGFDPRRFRSAAAYYVSGRLPYPSRLIRRVVDLCAVDGRCRVMDLGCGPGLLAVAFAPFAREVVAIDPEPEMLRIARERAAGAGVALTLVEGSSYDLRPDLGRFRLVTIGRAFHWMDRKETLQQLDSMIDPEGTVVLFGDHHRDLPDNRWNREYEALLDRYGPGARSAPWHTPAWLCHEAVLLDSPFDLLEGVAVVERRQTLVEVFVDRALSRSSTSPDRLGSKVDTLMGEVRELMGRFARDGLVTEVVEYSALIARRE
jgi:SAM-dependent methyltransferase